MASDAIWHEVRNLRRAGTPVVVSMGNYAASGGYQISGLPLLHITRWCLHVSSDNEANLRITRGVVHPKLAQLNSTHEIAGELQHAGISSSQA